MNRGTVAVGGLLLLLCSACGGVSSNGSSPTPTPSPSPSPGPVPEPIPPPAPPSVLVGAGDIGWCNSPWPEATAKLLDGIAGTVVALGDIAYMDGTANNFSECYDPNWGRHKQRTRPVPGNHDYHTSGAIPYFAYFGANAGQPPYGYYSYDVGSWHIVALNSNIPVEAGSSQVAWLRQDLEANKLNCTLAYWHHPLISSGTSGGVSWVRDLWRVLYDYNAEVVLNAHEHRYERYAPMDPNGVRTGRGLVEFVVGTGGAPLYPLRAPQPNLVTNASAFGVLKLTLNAGNYAWEFVPVPGESFRDSGTAACH